MNGGNTGGGSNGHASAPRSPLDGAREPLPRGAIADPYSQRHVPAPRAYGIAYPSPIVEDQVQPSGDSPMRRERGGFHPVPSRPSPGDIARQIAPPSQIERYPIIIGRNLTLETVSSRFRLELTGYRQLYVDMLDELIERDPHCYAVFNKRATSVANAKYTCVPPNLPDEDEKAQKATKKGAKKVSAKQGPYRAPATRKSQGSKRDRAQKIADECQQDFERIPRLKQHLASLAWADFYGMAGSEMIWDHDPRTKRWRPTDWVFLHSRRLSYPDPWNWDLYIWDQGAVIGSPFGDVRLPPGIFGWRVADYPGKFVIHSPQLRADYPTREGVGRELAYWMVLKHIAARAAPDYLERFSNPPTDITYATAKEDGAHRMASDLDIADAKAVVQAGVTRAWAHSDAIKWELKSPDGVGGRAKVTFIEWLKYCDDQMTKVCLGSTLGTDAATSGSRALGNTQRKDTLSIFQFSSECLGDSLDDSYVRTWCELNYPGEDDLWPHMKATVEDDPDPDVLADRGGKLAQYGVPVDADALAEMCGIPVVDRDDPEARVMRPIKQVGPAESPLAPYGGTNTPAAAQERQEQAQDAAQQEGEQAHQRAKELIAAKSPQQIAAEKKAEGGTPAAPGGQEPTDKPKAGEAPHGAGTAKDQNDDEEED